MSSTNGDNRRLPVRPLLPGFFQVVPMGPDRVQLRSAGRVVRLSGPGLGEVAPRVLNALDGRMTMPQLVDELGLEPSVVEALVQRLAIEGLIDEAGAGAYDDGDRVSPVLREFFAELGQPASAVQARVSSARVAVAGLGPVSRLAAIHLTAAGVGELALVDDSPLTPLDHAIVPGDPSEIGRSRSEVVAADCRRAGQGAGPVRLSGVTVSRSLDAALDGATAAVIAVDAAQTGAESANTACLRATVPFLLHEASTVGARVGPAVVPYRSPCYRCVVIRRLSHMRGHDEEVAYRQEVGGGRLAVREAALLSGCAALVAGLVSVETLRLVGGIHSAPTAGAVLVTDFRTLEVRREQVLRVPECPACGGPQEEVEIGERSATRP